MEFQMFLIYRDFADLKKYISWIAVYIKADGQD
jgi:hypothetical protein